MSLVPIPWQPDLYVHKDLLAKLEQIRERRGTPPYLYGSRSGWRSYADQKALWNAYQNGGNIASNPDSGNRTHMRGVAADLRDTSAAMQRACIAVGLQRDPAEAWHWQLSNWSSYPIIPTRLELAEVPAPNPTLPEEDDMTVRTIRYTGRTRTWAICDPRRKDGYVRTSDGDRAKALAALYVPNWGTGERDGWDYETDSITEFNNILTEAKIAHEEYVATLRAGIGGGTAAIATGFDGTITLTAK